MKRKHYLDEIDFQLQVQPVCALLGPRQVGKTTLAHMFIKEYFAGKAQFFDLENPIDLLRLENPMLALGEISEPLIVIDEIQRRPDLFPVLRVIVDSFEKKQKILILGSASQDLLRQSSETLAGRIGYIELPPFSLSETQDSARLWLRGGFPRSYLAESEKISYAWRKNYIKSFLERDLSNLGFNIPPQHMQRFWLMLSYYHGQIFNASEIGKSLEISHNTVRRYLDILSGTFMMRILSPWFENLRKRQVKSPKVYFRDSGILHTLLNITDKQQLITHPKLGSFWEGFALEEVIRVLGIRSEECYFWSTHANAELDLFIIKDGKRLGFEFKYSDAPKTTKSMHIALADLKLDKLIVVYPGNQNFSLDANIIVCGLEMIAAGKFLEVVMK